MLMPLSRNHLTVTGVSLQAVIPDFFYDIFYNELCQLKQRDGMPGHVMRRHATGDIRPERGTT